MNNVIQSYLKKMLGEVEIERREELKNVQPKQSSMATSILMPQSGTNDLLKSFLRGRK